MKGKYVYLHVDIIIIRPEYSCVLNKYSSQFHSKSIVDSMRIGTSKDQLKMVCHHRASVYRKEGRFFKTLKSIVSAGIHGFVKSVTNIGE
jgi:hypothetical protein